MWFEMGAFKSFFLMSFFKMLFIYQPTYATDINIKEIKGDVKNQP